MNPARPVSRRNPWPLGIGIFLVLFAVFTLGLVFLSVRNDMELVSTDYYDREIRYQEEIHRQQRTQALPETVAAIYDAAQNTLTITLPAAHAHRAVSGEIHLYRPAGAASDRRIALQPDAQGRQTLDTRELSAGLWRLRVHWRVDGEDFAFDEKLVIGARQPG
ncbi:MAG: FixH [Verrucomicrobia bacterium ADurb.Bin118]|jgi:hypothetical protein|nr:MAG: FixH [Verrucomicrobia bacterium ADurb.Bin118]